MTEEVDFNSVPCRTAGTFISTKEVSNGETRYRAINYLYATVAFLNQTGYEMLKAFNGKRTILDFSKEIASKNGNNIDKTATDVCKFIQHLIKQKIVYFKGDEPPAILETTFMIQPQEVWLSVTSKCNLHCITCFKDKNQIRKKDMSKEKLLNIIDEIKELGVGYIVVSGGEPFMRPDILDILERIASLDIMTLIITNGTLINKEIAKRLGEIKPKIIQVSLDGSTAEINDRIRGKGVYDKTIRGAKLLIEQNLDVRLYPTINRLNIHDLPNMRKLVNELRPGFNHLAFAKFHPTGRGLKNEKELNISEDEFLEIIKSFPKDKENKTEASSKKEATDLTHLLPTRIPYGARKINCGWGAATFSIEADGKVYPCHWLHFPEYQAGDLYEQNLIDIYHGSEVFARCRMMRVDSNIEGCQQCDYKYFCGGGCRARGLFREGRICGHDPECKTLLPHFECGLWTETLFKSLNETQKTS